MAAPAASLAVWSRNFLRLTLSEDGFWSLMASPSNMFWWDYFPAPFRRGTAESAAFRMAISLSHKPRSAIGVARPRHTSNWLRFGFVFQGRVIVFTNLLASFVHLTSFTYFPPPAPRLRSRHADPALREKHLATRRVRGGRGSPFAPAQHDWRPASAARLLGGPWCRHAFLLSLQIP